MITDSIINAITSFIVFACELFPTFNLNDYSQFSGVPAFVAEFWSLVFQWSGVFPVHNILFVFQLAFLMSVVAGGMSIARFTLNVIRGSGA